ELKELGAICATPLVTSDYIDKIESERGLGLANAPKVKPKVAVMTGGLIAGTKSFQADVIRNCGGDLVGPESDRFVPVNPESMLQTNPDIVILAADISAYDRDKNRQRQIMVDIANKFVTDPRFRSTKAAATGHVFPMDADILLREGARVDQLMSSI